MPIVYIKEQGAYIKKVEERLAVEKSGMRLADVPIHTLSDLAIIGNVQISTQAIHLLLKQGIDVSFFTFRGDLLGRIASENSKNIFLRFEQYRLYQDMEKRLRFARNIVENKINHQIHLIKNFRFNASENKEMQSEVQDIVKKLEQIKSGLENRRTSNEIMGAEGSGSAVYFRAYGKMFKSDIRFEKRSRRPPKDPVNVLLSLGYTLLTKEVESALEAESFETYLGFLHGIRYGRKSLSLDIVEEFRQPVIDRLVLRMFNKRMMTEADFHMEEDRIVLEENGFMKFIKTYEKWMNDSVSMREKRCFRSIIKSQIAHLKKAIKERGEYIPYHFACDFAVDRDDSDSVGAAGIGDAGDVGACGAVADGICDVEACDAEAVGTFTSDCDEV